MTTLKHLDFNWYAEKLLFLIYIIVRAGPNVRTGEAIPPAALPIGAWERTPRVHHPPHPHTGQDMVPEPQVTNYYNWL